MNSVKHSQNITNEQVLGMKKMAMPCPSAPERAELLSVASSFLPAIKSGALLLQVAVARGMERVPALLMLLT